MKWSDYFLLYTFLYGINKLTINCKKKIMPLICIRLFVCKYFCLYSSSVIINNFNIFSQLVTNEARQNIGRPLGTSFLCFRIICFNLRMTSNGFGFPNFLIKTNFNRPFTAVDISVYYLLSFVLFQNIGK